MEINYLKYSNSLMYTSIENVLKDAGCLQSGRNFSFKENFDRRYILIPLKKNLREFNLNREPYYRYKVSNFGFPEHARESFWGKRCCLVYMPFALYRFIEPLEDALRPNFAIFFNFSPWPPISK